MQSSNYKIILCDILNTENDTKATLVRRGAIVVHRGKIVDWGGAQKVVKRYSKYSPLELHLAEDFIALPGFFDMHFHWVQDDVRLLPKDSLLTWLSKYTWPHEAKFKSKSYTQKKVKEFTNRLLSAGTLGGLCYASIHSHTSEQALKNFKGDFKVGNVLMDMNSPSYLTHHSKAASKLALNHAKKYKSNYALTPRFAITTSPEVMKTCSKLSKKYASFIQTHLGETLEEIEAVLCIFRKIKGFENVTSYTEIYKRAGLLSKKTVVGHGIYLSPSELKLLSKTQTAIAHCPTSNAPVKDLGLGSGLFDFETIEKAKIPWALGSDIGGGPYLSMFDVMKSFVEQNAKKKNKKATYMKALYRATLAGAKILGLDKKTGNLKKGKEANFIFVPSPKVKKGESAESVLKEVISSVKKREDFDFLVKETWYKGEIVY